MAPPRTFDYDLLKRLVREHPEWPYADYADMLTLVARRGDPRARRVKPDSVRRVVCQYRDEWEDEGVKVPARGVLNPDLLPPLGSVAPSQRMSTPLRYLREISKERRGEAPVTDNEKIMRRQALRWKSRLEHNRELVDITPNGYVEVRPAVASELDSNGQLRELAAWAIPGYELRGRESLRGRG